VFLHFRALFVHFKQFIYLRLKIFMWTVENPEIPTERITDVSNGYFIGNVDKFRREFQFMAQ
jgi:hypothetical protein